MTFTLTNHADTIEARIRANRTLPLTVDWADELLFPAYDGLSLVNVPHTIAELLDAPLVRSTPLDPAIWNGSPPPDVRRVVLFLMDGMGYKHLQLLTEEDSEIRDLVAELTGGRGPLPLTSVAPSTTAVALSSLWTGGVPAATGMLGTILFLHEFSTYANMLTYAPHKGDQNPRRFENDGLPPEDFVPLSGLADHMQLYGVQTDLVLDRKLTFTGLSRILHRGVNGAYRHANFADFMLRAHQALSETAGKLAYVNIYWPAVDTLAHIYGVINEYTAAEIKGRLRDLRDLFASPDVRDGQTLVIIMADHGHHEAPRTMSFDDDPEYRPIKQTLQLRPVGDARLPMVYVRNGQLDALKAAIDDNYGDHLTYLDSREALDAGFFGPRPHADGTPNRIGDLVLVPRLSYRYRAADMSPHLVSVHAGLSDWEMLVPFMWQVI